MRLQPIWLAGLALLLSACEGGGDPVEQALREASAAHQAAATETTAEIEAKSSTPAADTPAADQAYVEAAIEEHLAAIARAESTLRETSDPALRQLARTTIEARKAEIAALQAWRPANASAE